MLRNLQLDDLLSFNLIHDDVLIILLQSYGDSAKKKAIKRRATINIFSYLRRENVLHWTVSLKFIYVSDFISEAEESS
jgi:hypothetical protein